MTLFLTYMVELYKELTLYDDVQRTDILTRATLSQVAKYTCPVFSVLQL